MTLSATYLAFLNNPSRAALADNAALHYITTLTSLHDAAAIVKHLAVQDKLLKKTSQKILDAVEGRHALSVDVETTIEFQNGGGAYLPGLDDNFISDRTVTFPMVHIVHFDDAGRIVQMRQYWDQGALLKQMDVIGARSRNWPIRDSKEQSRLITSSSAAVAHSDSAPSSRPSTASRGADDVSVSSLSRGSTNNAMNDPHASLSLFQPREVDESSVSVAHPNVPRVASAKPAPREYSELFVGGDDSPAPAQQKFPVKGGSSKNFKSNRLFEEDTEEDRASATPIRSIKTSEKKYNHFEFGDPEDEPTPRGRDTSRPAKSSSNWNFEDFVTPEKTAPKTLPAAVRHFGWSDDEAESPVHRPIVHKARPDADAHFEFNDKNTPAAKKQQPSSKGSTSNKSQGLYKDHVTGDDDNDGTATGDNHLRDQHNTTTKNRSTDFGAHFEMNDNSPAPVKRDENTRPDATENQYKINIAGNGMGGRKGTEALSLFSESPQKPVHDRKIGHHTGIQTTGDGMGGRKGADKSFWDF